MHRYQDDAHEGGESEKFQASHVRMKKQPAKRQGMRLTSYEMSRSSLPQNAGKELVKEPMRQF